MQENCLKSTKKWKIIGERFCYYEGQVYKMMEKQMRSEQGWADGGRGGGRGVKGSRLDEKLLLLRP